MTGDQREKAVLAAMAATFKQDYMTNDRLEAASKGYGSLVIPVYCAPNSLAEGVFCAIGAPTMSLMNNRMNLVDPAWASLSLDMTIEKAVREAVLAGAAVGPEPPRASLRPSPDQEQRREERARGA